MVIDGILRISFAGENTRWQFALFLEGKGRQDLPNQNQIPNEDFFSLFFFDMLLLDHAYRRTHQAEPRISNSIICYFHNQDSHSKSA